MTNDDVILLSEIAKPAIDELENFLIELSLLNDALSEVSAPIESELRNNNLIQHYDIASVPVSLQAVDAASVLDPQAGIAIAHALGARISTGDDPITKQKTMTGPNGLSFRRMYPLLRLALEFELLHDVTEFTIIDNSYWSILMDSNQVVTSHRDNRTYDNTTYEKCSDLINTCYGKDGYFLKVLKNKNLIAISKMAVSSTLTKERGITPSIPDRVLASKILRENEVIMPRSLISATTGVFGVERDIYGWEDVKYAYSEKCDNPIKVIFYKPWEYQRAYRIEYHEGIDLRQLLGRIKYETRILGIMEPVSQYLVDILTKQIKGIIPLYPQLTMLKYPQLIGQYRT